MTTLSKEEVDLAAEKFDYSEFSSEFRISADGLHAFADHIATLARADLVAENERLHNDLLDALDCKQGKGPTALATVIAERDELRAENERLKSEFNDYRRATDLAYKGSEQETKDQLTTTRTALAAAEARETQLRKAIVMFRCEKAVGKAHSVRKTEGYAAMQEAVFDQPRDDSALRRLLAEAKAGVYEECANVCEISDRYRGDYFAAKIRELAEKAKA